MNRGRRVRAPLGMVDVLVQGPAERDVDHLLTSADAQQRKVAGAGGADEVELERVEIMDGRLGVWFRFLPRSARVRCPAHRG